MRRKIKLILAQKLLVENIEKYTSERTDVKKSEKSDTYLFAET